MNIVVIIGKNDIEITSIAITYSLKCLEMYGSVHVVLIGNRVEIEFQRISDIHIFDIIYDISSGVGRVYAYERSKNKRGYDTKKRNSLYDFCEEEFYMAVEPISDNNLFKIIDQANKVVTF